MNANELAEIIQHLENAKYIGASKAATMLRQQQAEIEALKAEASPYKSITNTKIEPTVVSYTHPVKELTNAEILWLADEYSDEENLVADCVGFARALLLEAQEK